MDVTYVRIRIADSERAGNMRPKEDKVVISFYTTTMAMKMEKICKEQHVDGRIIPLPKEISAGCGLAFCSSQIDVDYWTGFMDKNQIEYENIKRMMV